VLFFFLIFSNSILTLGFTSAADVTAPPLARDPTVDGLHAGDLGVAEGATEAEEKEDVRQQQQCNTRLFKP